MNDIASLSSGSRISLVTSYDNSHCPEHMLDGRNETFWTSTGMYPQEFIISFASLMRVSSISITSYNIRSLKIERCSLNDPEEFEHVVEKIFDHNEGHLQTNEIRVDNISAVHLRFIITDAFDHFCQIFKVICDGSPVSK